MPTLIFNYTGSAQTFAVPYNISGTLLVEVAGAGGGGSRGGTGGFVLGKLAVTPGDTLRLYVGGTGGPVTAGYNGGGAGGTDPAGYYGFGGGGASDIRVGGTGYANRVVVAAGGGGEGQSGVGVFNPGGDGGAATGEGGGGTGFGTGGTQTAGGLAGNAVGNANANGRPGSLGAGGSGGSPVSPYFAGGGGGGGGYYGGGGGGSADANHGAGGGGGGSNYVDGLVTVEENIRGGGNAATQSGSIILFWTVRPDVPGLDTLNVSAGMGFNTLVTEITPLALGGQVTLASSGQVVRTAPLPIQSSASLAIARGPSTLPEILAISAQASLNTLGFLTRFGASAFAANAHLTLQETLASLPLSAHVVLTIGPSLQQLHVVSLASTARLTIAGSDRKLSTLVLSGTARVNLTGGKAFTLVSVMAVRGLLSQSGALSQSWAVQMRPTAEMTVTATHITLGVLHTLAASALMVIVNPIHHETSLRLQATGQLTIIPRELLFVGPNFIVTAMLASTDTSLANTVPMSAHGALVLINTPDDPILIFDPPYLTVTGQHSTMKFFVGSLPNRGDVRQLVTNLYDS